MINVLNKKTSKKYKKKGNVEFDGAYIHKFDLALRNFELFVQEENGFRILKEKSS